MKIFALILGYLGIVQGILQRSDKKYIAESHSGLEVLGGFQAANPYCNFI